MVPPPLQMSPQHADSIPHHHLGQVCDQILAAAPGDSDALHAKLVNLIELGKMEEALQVRCRPKMALKSGTCPLISARALSRTHSMQVVESSPELAEICRFEWAYCLYSLSREKEALSLLMTSKGAEPSDARGLQLAAQILYRQGDYAKAADYFQKSEATGGPSAELSTNILAAQVSAGGGAAAADYAKRITEGGNSEAYSSQFELIYNYACAAIRINQLGLAERLLKRAIDLCRETLSPEEYTEEEIEVRAHCPQRRNDACTHARRQASRGRERERGCGKDRDRDSGAIHPASDPPRSHLESPGVP